jgi:hypothetical protein
VTPLPEGTLLYIQSKSPLALLVIGSVTREAVLGQDRTNLSVEVDLSCRDLNRTRFHCRGIGPPLSSRIDPLANGVDLTWRQDQSRRRRGHAGGIFSGQTLKQDTARRIARDHERAHKIPRVQSKVSLPSAFVRAVAGETRLREDRPDVLREFDRLSACCSRGAEITRQRADKHERKDWQENKK